MKRYNTRDINFFLSATLVFIFICVISFGMKTVIPGSELPIEIKSFIDKHFSGDQVTHAIREKDGIRISYHVNVKGEYQLEFNRKFEIVDIEGMNAIPSSMIPVAIQNYVSEKFPGNYITDWERDRNRQEVELDNGLDLNFSLSGNFIGYDK